MPFATLASLPVKELFNGTIRGQYVHLEKLTFGEVTLQPGTQLPRHSHPHEQMTYVIEGEFEFTIGTETAVLRSGMVAIVPSGVEHSGRTLTTCRVIDIFSPVREDYRT
jgi:quercetin dioxygenase-like cupin family protein